MLYGKLQVYNLHIGWVGSEREEVKVEEKGEEAGGEENQLSSYKDISDV